MDKIILEGPINSTSLGQTFVSLLYQFYLNDDSIILFPKHEPELSCFDGLLPEEFSQWINKSCDRNIEKYKRKYPAINWWHIRGSEKTLTDNQILYTFHELDQLTAAEVNILNSQKKTFTCSHYSKEVFEDYGVSNTTVIPLGFDHLSFKQNDQGQSIRERGIISFGLYGKAERRKNHIEVVRAWVKKYGNNQKYRLNMSIWNHFLPESGPFSLEAFLGECFEGKPKPFNVNILPFSKTNVEYNNLLNASDVVIDMSGGESWSLPSFTSVALGKYAVILNATGMKEWANDENSVLVKPSGQKPCYDGFFFKHNDSFNQGNLFCFEEDKFLEACEIAENLYQDNPLNENGLELQDKFNWTKTYKLIKENL